jgi:magnesium transporter
LEKGKNMENDIITENNIGLPPGTPVYVGDRPASAMDVLTLVYNASFAEMTDVEDVEKIPACGDDATMWININGLKDIDSIKKLAAVYHIHPLTVEDILNTKQQPKVEEFEHYRFISIKSIQREKTFPPREEKKRFFKKSLLKRWEQSDDAEEFLIDQISIVITKNVLLTFQEISGDPFTGVRKRILDNIGQIRKMGADYLAYTVIDAVVDDYYLALAHLEDNIEDIEDRAVITNDDIFIAEIQETKNYLFQIKRAMMPLRENLAIISRQNIVLKDDSLKPFLQDLRENLNNAIETVENYREWLSNIMDINLSVLSYQLNKVMKIMAVISSIFIPLTFIAGVYGMNFSNMPELSQPWGYPIVLMCMGFISVIMILFFKARRWF